MVKRYPRCCVFAAPRKGFFAVDTGQDFKGNPPGILRQQNSVKYSSDANATIDIIMCIRDSVNVFLKISSNSCEFLKILLKSHAFSRFYSGILLFPLVAFQSELGTDSTGRCICAPASCHFTGYPAPCEQNTESGVFSTSRSGA